MWNHVPEPARAVGEIWFEPADESEISIDLSKGRKGDVEAARRLLRRFCSAVTERKQIDDRIMEHLAQAFLSILDGDTSADRALQLVKKRGRQINPDHTERNLDIWLKMRKQIRNGLTVVEASVKVGKQFFKSELTIQEIYKDMKKLQLRLLAEGREVTEEEWKEIKKLAKEKNLVEQ